LAIDQRLCRRSVGQCTGLVLIIDNSSETSTLCGVTVGDSEAIIVAADSVRDVTVDHFRKPLLGDGGARPIAFTEMLQSNETLVCGSDGLFKYVGFRQLAAIIRHHGVDLESAADALLNALRLPSGDQYDDACVALIRDDRVRAASAARR
jgi:PPM family protein phosphatase